MSFFESCLINCLFTDIIKIKFLLTIKTSCGRIEKKDNKLSLYIFIYSRAK